MVKKATIYFSIIAVVIGAVFFVNGFILAWDPPTQDPPEVGSGFTAPINTGSVGQYKEGGLILNTGGAQNGLIVDQGSVGIGTTEPDEDLKLDVEGKVGATEYCDQDGNNCAVAAELGGGGLSDIERVSCTSGVGATSAACMAQCPANYVVIGGGCDTNAGRWYIERTAPANEDTAWYCRAVEDHGSGERNRRVYGYAICTSQ